MEFGSSSSEGAIKRSCGMESSENEKLPHDLVMEILSWLPVVYLSSFRFVSKAWFHSIIEDCNFAKLHYDRSLLSKPNPYIFATKLEDPFMEEDDANIMLATDFESCNEAVPLEFPFQCRSIYSLIGICNGLLCYSPLGNQEIFIWNPLIKDDFSIPCLPVPSIRFPGYHVCTGFGFGFDQDTNVYKVVRFFNEYGSYNVQQRYYEAWTQISVYTIGTFSMWRTVETGIRSDFNHVGIMPLVNGALHWMTNKKPGTLSFYTLSTFNLKNEVIGELPIPDGISMEEIVELAGSLCFIHRPEYFGELHIWTMGDYGVVSSWSRRYIIGNPEGYIPFYHLSTFGFTNSGDIILRRFCRNLLLYNPESDTVRDLKKFPFSIGCTFSLQGSIISPSLTVQAGLRRSLLEEES